MNMGNNGFSIFNLGPTINISSGESLDEYSSSSSSESESEAESEELIDTVGPSGEDYWRSQESRPCRSLSTDLQLSLEIVQQVENDLDFYELISLVFLLYDRHTALNVMFTMLNEDPDCFVRDKLSNWARSSGSKSIMLIEALAVIQNYRILQKLGYSKTPIDSHFCPLWDTSLQLDRIKKALYRLSEYLTVDQAKDLINRIRRNGNFANDITLTCDPAYLEFHLLFWMSREFIQIDKEVKLENLTKHLKFMDLLDKASELNTIAANENEKRRKKDTLRHDAYPIKDATNPGLVIIFNMAEFVKNVDKRPEKKHMQPNPALNDRKGSLNDVYRLRKIFSNLNFTVTEEHDIPDYELIPKIEQRIRMEFKPNVHSMLFVCVLSHGAEDVVYAVNSIPVSIRDIQNIVSGPQSPVESILKDIPKVIIISSCQGDKPLCVEPAKPTTQLCEPDTPRASASSNLLLTDGNQLCFDGRLDGPKPFADLLICMATIKGYIAVRSTKDGTKYIQELCDHIEQLHQTEHFIDIVTRVHDKLNGAKMHVKNVPEEMRNCSECHEPCVCVYMTPQVRDYTLRKKLFLVRK